MFYNMQTYNMRFITNFIDDYHLIGSGGDDTSLILLTKSFIIYYQIFIESEMGRKEFKCLKELRKDDKYY